MNPLQYTSEEMFSSTELIRKSKLVFDKLHKNEIEKAIILRDGKPSFMLLDFSVYEKIMGDYLSLKESLQKHDVKDNNKTNYEKKSIEDTETIEKNQNNSLDADELNEKDLQEALAQIDNLDLGNDLADNLKEEKEPLKEFWE